jgi:tripartite-type tricarboxylate transporter receptor subunit TctC
MNHFSTLTGATGITRRRALAYLAGPALLGSPAARSAEDANAYPTRPIKILIGFPPGGSTDGPVRVLAEAVSKILKQPLIVENRAGAGGTLPAVALQATAADGYTLGISSLGINRLPYTTGIKWNPASDLSYIIGLTGYAFGIVVPAASPIRTWADYVAAAKANPGKVTFSTPGVATTNHLTMEIIARRAGITLNHIPYKGSADSLQALLAGQVDSAAETSAWAPFVRDGKMRLIATWGAKRMNGFPDAPTLRELGVPLTQTSPWGLIAPKGLDVTIAKRLHDVFKFAMEQPEFRQALARYEMEPAYLSSAAFQTFTVQSMRQEKDILDALGLSKT